jgi:alanyl-tRNA synthetase
MYEPRQAMKPTPTVPSPERIVATLRDVLGEHVDERDSRRIVITVAHFRSITDEQRTAIEERLSRDVGEPVWLLGDEMIAAGVRRLTFACGPAPLRLPPGSGPHW